MLFFKSKQQKMNKTDEKKNMGSIKSVCQNLLQLIDDGSAYTDVPAKKIGDVTEMGYIEYDKNFWSLLISLYKMLGEDFNYNTNMKEEEIKEKEIKTLNLRQISTYLTFIIRGERFAEGHVAAYIKNGILKNLILRVNELC